MSAPEASGTSTMSEPVIGLSSYGETARWGAWEEPAVLLPASYAEQVRAVGGVPVILPSVPGIADAVSRLDGLVLTGGRDVDPARYGAAADPHTSGVSQARDEAELGLLTAALAAGLPVLGICRGMQVINVARGGTLRQHLPADGGHTPTPGTYGSHRVRIAPGSRLAGILGDGEFDVPTSHHQAVDRLGRGLSTTAWAGDGVPEAIELNPLNGNAGQFLLAVQWHPEVGGDPRLMRAFVAAAANASHARQAHFDLSAKTHRKWGRAGRQGTPQRVTRLAGGGVGRGTREGRGLGVAGHRGVTAGGVVAARGWGVHGTGEQRAGCGVTRHATRRGGRPGSRMVRGAGPARDGRRPLSAGRTGGRRG